MTELKGVDYALFGGSSLFNEKRYKFDDFMEGIPGWVSSSLKGFRSIANGNRVLVLPSITGIEVRQRHVCVCADRQCVAGKGR